jgi:biotin synthase
MAMALQAKLANRGDAFSLCSIINAKSGQCGEDCHFCVQSAHFTTDAPVYPLKSKDEVVAAAREAKEIGSHRFSIVTSGRGMNDRETDMVADMVATIIDEVGIPVCASLGIMDTAKLKRLKEAGLSRYHHNLETSREFFPKIVTTHTFEDRIDTIMASREAGLQVCSGGIFGLGESEDDRISMALTLRECEVDSVPLNILIPLPGTPLADRPQLTAPEILRTIALYRLILPDLAIRLAAGRGEKKFQDFLGTAFMAGADAMMIGGYLTQGCRPPAEDHQFVREMKMLWGR